MHLSDLLTELAPTSVSGPVDRHVRRVVHDSRMAGPDDVFVALRGLKVDGRAFAPKLGCAAVVADGPVQVHPGTTEIQVRDARLALAQAAAALAGHPSRVLPVMGITGTNGKTTATWMIEAMATASGRKAGVIGTTGHRVAGVAQPASHTTPEAPVFQGLLAEMRDAGCDVAAVEVSSIGLSLRRVDATVFRAAGFTSFSRDHIDFHHSMDAYFTAKRRLFTELLAPDGIAVINGDDPAAARLLPLQAQVWRAIAGPDIGAEIYCTDVQLQVDGTRCMVHTPRGNGALALALLGRHNLQNALVALGCALAVGLPLQACLDGLAALPAVPGRLEPVPNAAGIHVLVDYAHSPDAMERVLESLRPLTHGRILTVFGCGGDRDAGKRPLMGAAASAGSDHVVVTSDNPRSEDPDEIIRQILPGVTGTSTVEPDRRAAIALAIAMARPGDVVLLAGKGHEQTQEIGGQKLPLDDRAVAAAALADAQVTP